MQKTFPLLILLLFLLPGCDIEKRERELEQRALEVTHRERVLELKTQELNERQQQLDSLTVEQRNDSLHQIYPQLIGIWNVKMICDETTCPGSAIGDTKTEQWEFVLRDNQLIAIAVSKNKLSRIYTGDYRDSLIVLEAQSDSTTHIQVQLKFDKDKILSGTRKIIRSDECFINYELTLKK